MEKPSSPSAHWRPRADVDAHRPRVRVRTWMATSVAAKFAVLMAVDARGSVVGRVACAPRQPVGGQGPPHPCHAGGGRPDAACAPPWTLLTVGMAEGARLLSLLQRDGMAALRPAQPARASVGGTGLLQPVCRTA